VPEITPGPDQLPPGVAASRVIDSASAQKGPRVKIVASLIIQMNVAF
jgi:hypothetical protein